jgi:hypothetical protein
MTYFPDKMEPYEPNSSAECGNLHNSSPHCPFTAVDNNSEVLDVNVSLLEEVIRSFNRYEVTCRGRNLIKEVHWLIESLNSQKATEVKISLAEKVKFDPSTGTRSLRSKPKGGQSRLLSPSTATEVIRSFNSYEVTEVVIISLWRRPFSLPEDMLSWRPTRTFNSPVRIIPTFKILP